MIQKFLVLQLFLIFTSIFLTFYHFFLETRAKVFPSEISTMAPIYFPGILLDYSFFLPASFKPRKYKNENILKEAFQYSHTVSVVRHSSSIDQNILKAI